MVEDIPERGGWFRSRAPVEPPARHEAPGTEQPIEVHEHIEVTEEMPRTSQGAPLAEPVDERYREGPVDERYREGPIDERYREGPVDERYREGPADERYREEPGFREERLRVYQEHIATRRTRRFAATGVLMFGLTLVTAAWIFGSALFADMPFGLLGPEEVLAMGLLAFVVGTALAFGDAAGFVGALALSWIAGLAALLVAVRTYLVEFDVTATNQALIALLGVFGLLVMVASTSAFVSWRGRRLQSRVLGHERDMRRDRGRVT